MMLESSCKRKIAWSCLIHCFVLGHTFIKTKVAVKNLPTFGKKFRKGHEQATWLHGTRGRRKIHRHGQTSLGSFWERMEYTMKNCLRQTYGSLPFAMLRVYKHLYPSLSLENLGKLSQSIVNGTHHPKHNRLSAGIALTADPTTTMHHRVM